MWNVYPIHQLITFYYIETMYEAMMYIAFFSCHYQVYLIIPIGIRCFPLCLCVLCTLQHCSEINNIFYI